MVKQRGEGVAVVLSGVAVSAWKDAEFNEFNQLRSNAGHSAGLSA